MTKQLTLIDTPIAWRLDERTRAVGREGIARARAALTAGLQAAPLPSGSPGSLPPSPATRADRPPPPAGSPPPRPRPVSRRPAAAGRRAGRRPAGGGSDRQAA